jgi:hypothetical protein
LIGIEDSIRMPSLCIFSNQSPGVRSGARLLLLSVVVAFQARSAHAGTTVTFLGTPASENFGSQTVGSPTSAQVLNFSVAKGSVGSIAVLTMGAPNLDFVRQPGDTCMAAAYTAATDCTVSVAFAPKGPGLRRGAVVFFSGAGNTGTVLANVPIYGIGISPQISFGNPTPVTTVPVANGFGFDGLFGLAIDGANNVFVSDYDQDRIVEIPAGGGDPFVLNPTGLFRVAKGSGMAVDGAGNLYIAGFAGNHIFKVPIGGGTPLQLNPVVNGVAISGPSDVALDGAGNLYIADCFNNRVVEVPAGGGAATAIGGEIAGVQLTYPNAVAVDGTGNLFVTDQANRRIVEFPASGGTPFVLISTAPIIPTGLALNAAGDLYIADGTQILKVPADGGAPTVIIPDVPMYGSPFSPASVRIDLSGNLWISDIGHERVIELETSQPAGLNFSSTLLGATSSDSPQVVSIENSGNAPLEFSAITYPLDFPEGNPGANPECAASSELSSAASCTLTVNFSPRSTDIPSLLTEPVSLTDNNLNSVGSAQQITASGIAQQLPKVSLKASLLSLPWNTPVTLTATVAGRGVAATGSMQFFSGSILLGTETLAGGVATLVTQNLPPGSNSITASYQGDQLYLPAQSLAVAISVGRATSTITVVAAPDTLNAGNPLSLTATVPPQDQGATPTGSVTFLLDGASAGVVHLAAGVAVLPISTLSAGTHSVIAEYSGDAKYAGLTSTAIQVTANPITPTLRLMFSANPIKYFWTEYLYLVVDSTLSPKVPTGTVDFYAGASFIGRGTLSGPRASINTNTLPAGTYSITGRYNGDSIYLPVTSNAMQLQVERIALPVTLTATPVTLNVQSPLQLTAKVTTTGAEIPPTGTLQFFDGTVAMGTVPIAGNIATFAVPTPTAGRHYYSAQFSGDSNYLMGSSAKATVNVNKINDTLTTTSSANPSIFGSPVIFTVTVGGTLNGVAPTGTVTLNHAGTMMQAALSNGQATFTIADLPVGSATLYAKYPGDANYNAASAPAFTQTVQKVQ